MDGHEKQVVPEITEVTDSARRSFFIVNRCGNVHGGDAVPIKPNRQLGVEIEAPPTSDTVQDLKGRDDGI